ncbi:MAG: peptide chain release factor 1 [Candidatus Geothermincolia bacterium]
MTARLDEMEARLDDVNRRLGDPEVSKDQSAYRDLGRLRAELAEVVDLYRDFKSVVAQLADAEQMLKEARDAEMEEFLREEMAGLQSQRASLEERLELLLIPRDPRDAKDVIVEIRAGAGGDEASLFAGDLARMYMRYAEAQGWKTEPLSSSPSDMGGFKEVIFEVRGRGAYSRLKFESGVHRVQRIPVTESGGRIHTSTATVAVLPEAEEVEVELDPNDLRIDIFRSTGPGGQSVNTTDSAVRITHVPTGVVVSCQDEKSQLQNKEKALRILRARLLRVEQERQQREQAEARRAQVGTGDRSERIRTYNFPQGRVTDHRVGVTLHNLEAVLSGEINDFIDALQSAENAEKLKELSRPSASL